MLTKLPSPSADKLIRETSRAYRTRTGVALHVWNKSTDVLDGLIAAYGGNWYRHRSGFVWVCARRVTLRLISKQVGQMEELDDLLDQLRYEAQVSKAGASTASADSVGNARSESSKHNGPKEVG